MIPPICDDYRCFEPAPPPHCSTCKLLKLNNNPVCNDACNTPGCPMICFKVLKTCQEICGQESECLGQPCAPLWLANENPCEGNNLRTCVRVLNEPFVPFPGAPGVSTSYTWIYVGIGASMGLLLIVLLICLAFRESQTEQYVVYSRNDAKSQVPDRAQLSEYALAPIPMKPQTPRKSRSRSGGARS